MKRIDLHTHTIKTISDNTEFEFSISFLKRYVEYAKLDAIAITNHNTFDLVQFNEITNNLDIVVFPGVEVDVMKGHLLVISPIEKVPEFNEQCEKLNKLILSQDSTIELAEFKSIFPNYNEYLLIPHVDKKPKLNMSTISEIGGIDSGEVQSIKKFFYMKNAQDQLTPLIFSDLRMYDRNKDDKYLYPSRFTYMDISNIDIPSIKLALKDKHKISISEKGANETFDIIPNQVQASSKLNLIIGKRSTGKTHTLRQIVSNLQDSNFNNIKYIEQFQIIKESEDTNFNNIKNEEKKDMLNKYLDSLRKIVETIVAIDIDEVDNRMKKYIETLVEYAEDHTLNDEYSKCHLFTEHSYDAIEPNIIKKLADSSYSLLSEIVNKDHGYGKFIQKHISNKTLINLTIEMVKIYEEELKSYKLKKKVDGIVKPIKNALGEQSAIKPVDETNFSTFFKSKKIIEYFDSYIKLLNIEREIERKDLFRFEAILKKEPYTTATEISKELGGSGYSAALKLYKQDNYYLYIKELINKNVDAELLHYSLFNCTLEICNKHNTPISHGERAEYNLLRNIENAYNYDVLLLDEPEASFDNVFIHDFVIKKLKELSERITVFLVTHNNTLGSNLLPNYIIYTQFNDKKYVTGNYSKEECFEIYSGTFDSGNLLSSNGGKEANYIALMDSMEAGESAYDKRREIYENLRNKQ